MDRRETDPRHLCYQVRSSTNVKSILSAHHSHSLVSVISWHAGRVGYMSSWPPTTAKYMLTPVGTWYAAVRRRIQVHMSSCHQPHRHQTLLYTPLLRNRLRRKARGTHGVFCYTKRGPLIRTGSSHLTDNTGLPQALPTCVGPDRPPKYEVVTAGDYVKSRLEATYAHSK